MGPRPLGIRSRPYATINTTDEDHENNHTANATNNLPPLSPTIYQDDSGLSFEKDNDDDDHDDDDEENYESVATQSLDLQHQLDTAESQTNERCLRLKFVIFLSFLTVMVIFGKEYYNIHGSGSGSGSTKIISDEFTEEEYKEVRDPTNYHSSSGVRGKSSKPSPPNNESSSTTTSSTGGGEEEEDKGGICQDDPNFIYKSKSCTKYVGKKIDKAELLQRRCEKGTGIMSSNNDGAAAAAAVELLIKDFCKSSCGLCGESSSGILNGDEFTEEEKEIIKEQIEEEVDEGMLEVSEEVDELTTMTEKSNNGDGSDADDDVLNEDEYVIQDGLEEDEGFLNEEINDIVEKIAEAQADDDGVLAEEKEEYIEELQEELIEDSDMEEEVEELEGELEMVEELKEDLEGVEELGELIGEGNDGNDGDEGVDEDALSLGDKDDMPDYFVPLTHKERKEMKGKLRETLLQTKNALRMSASVKNRMAVTDNQRTLTLSLSTPKQFMHMHHMKTGGTSVDGLIRCALNRQKVLHDGTAISYSSMSECGSTVRSCMNTLADKLGATLSNNVFYHNDADGAPIHDAPFDPADETLNIPIDDMNVCKTSETNVMSYCASLHAVRTFGWKEADKITVIRNPIDRAWSMYRFTLKSCYDCQELKDVLKQIYSGTFTSKKSGRDDGDNVVPNFMYEPNNSCAVQLIGHQSTNLLSSVDLYNVANDVRFPREADIVHEAVRNLRQDFTWIGLTDRIQESVEGFRQIFPFLAENLNDAAKAIQEEFQTRGEELEDNKLLLPKGYSDANSCPFEHKNGGHDPTCGTTELDDETKEWIMKLNRRDMAVYKAAVERFELQMEVLQEYNDGNL
jgi:hypothetical protein